MRLDTTIADGPTHQRSLRFRHHIDGRLNRPITEHLHCRLPLDLGCLAIRIRCTQLIIRPYHLGSFQTPRSDDRKRTDSRLASTRVARRASDSRLTDGPLCTQPFLQGGGHTCWEIKVSLPIEGYIPPHSPGSHGLVCRVIPARRARAGARAPRWPLAPCCRCPGCFARHFHAR